MNFSPPSRATSRDQQSLHLDRGPSHGAVAAHGIEFDDSRERTLHDELAPGTSFRHYMLEQLRQRTHVRMAIGILYIAISILYLIWRSTVFNPDAPLFSFIFYLAEVVGVVLATTIIVIAWRYRYRQFVPAPLGLKVDLFIPTYNESVEMVRRTTLAAMRIRYPHETWLLDDGNRAAVKAIADELGCHYIAREEPVAAKPGNLNNALKYATGDFVAIMDADFVAQVNFLDRLLGYFSDADVAFVQCPQSYYNITAFQYRSENHDRYLWHDEGPFYDVLQPGRDYWNATSSCGTSIVYRRSAVDAIGGFAPETVTEDMHTAVRLHRRGFKSVYHPEPLAFGVAPNDLAEYAKTRHRWGQGNIQSLRCERVPFSRGLSFMQRLCYLQFGLLYLEGWQRLILYLTPPLVLMTGIYPVANTQLFFAFFIPYIVLDYLCFEETLRGYGRVYLNEQLCMSRFPIYIRATFALFYDYARWRVSSKKIVGNLPILLLSPQIAVLLLNLVGLGFGISTIVNEPFPEVPHWITGFVCLFAGLYVLLAALVIKEAVKRAKYKRTDFRFDVPLPVRVENTRGAPVYGVVSSISTAGMTLTTANAAAVAELSNDLSGCIYLPNGPIQFSATRESLESVRRAQHTRLRKGEIAVLFQWQSQADKDRLDQTLHACGWHRRFVHPSGYMTTPMEWLERKLRRQPPVAPLEKWKYVIYRRGHHGLGERFALGIMSLARGPFANRFVAFETLPIGLPLTVIDPSAPGFSNREIVITARGAHPDPSEVELADAAMIIYEIRPGADNKRRAGSGRRVAEDAAVVPIG